MAMVEFLMNELSQIFVRSDGQLLKNDLGFRDGAYYSRWQRIYGLMIANGYIFWNFKTPVSHK